MQEGAAAVVGIGMTELSRESGRSELALTVEAIGAALADASIAPEDVDGFVTSTEDSSDPVQVAHALGCRQMRFYSRAPFGGGGACATVEHADLALRGGAADVVVVYRGLNGRSGQRYGQGQAESAATYFPMTAPHGLIVPGHRMALPLHRYMWEHGLSNTDFAPISIAMRKFAATNPAAIFYNRPISFEEHEDSAWVAEPVLKVLDCCLETDGAAACVLTRRSATSERAVSIRASASGAVSAGELVADYYGSRMSDLPDSRIVAESLWSRSGLSPADIDVAILYDHFGPFVMLQLEAYGFCERGKGAAYIRDQGIGIEASLPVNPHGGLLGEGYVHGMNGICEAVRQLRGTAANQCRGASHALVTAGPGVGATSGLILEAT